MNIRFDDFNWMLGQDAAKDAAAPAKDGAAPAKDAPAGNATAGATPQKPGGGFGDMSFIIMMVVILVIFFFFMRRSQKRQADEQEKMVLALKPGQRVMLHSGLYGKVDKVDSENREVRLLVDDQKNVTLTYNILAINKVINEEVQPVKKD
ncbi:MAG: preprotein translocase subunit YajC [Planctomycetes bacterium]|nr:preprotein translocase subunit YajC [Planctomycetota bacterium]